MPSGPRERLQAMADSLEGKELEAAVRAMEVVVERDVGGRVKRLDKKGERGALFGLKKVRLTWWGGDVMQIHYDIPCTPESNHPSLTIVPFIGNQ